MYPVYITDWLKVFPKEQFLVLRMDDWHTNCQTILKEIYTFRNIRKYIVKNTTFFADFLKAVTKELSRTTIRLYRAEYEIVTQIRQGNELTYCQALCITITLTNAGVWIQWKAEESVKYHPILVLSLRSHNYC